MTTPASNGRGEGAEQLVWELFRLKIINRLDHDRLKQATELASAYAQAVAKKAVEDAQAKIKDLELGHMVLRNLHMGRVEEAIEYQDTIAALRSELAEAKKQNELFRGIIRAAYLDALDSIAAMTARALNTQEPERRLTHDQQVKLGRDLATYGVRESAEATAALLRAKEPESAESVPPERSV